MEREISREEKEFLASYDDSKYAKPSVTADIVIFSVFDEETDNYRKLPERRLKVLLVQRGGHPYKGCYALPGGFAHKGESLEVCARRELREETGVDCGFLHQLRTFSEPERDPRGWTITGSYLALLDASQYRVQAGDDAANAMWFEVSFRQVQGEGLYRLVLRHEEIELQAVLRGERDETGLQFELADAGAIAFDHAVIIAYAVSQLRQWMASTEIAFRLVPETFTLTQLQQIYETVCDVHFLAPAFRRKISDMVVATEQMTSEEGHRPARLYRRNSRTEIEKQQ